MKITKTGTSKEGLLVIGFILSVSLGFLLGVGFVMSTQDQESLIETAAFNSYSSSLYGCVQISKQNGNKNWQECVDISNEVAKTTREILTKEPILLGK